jgi:hypothetical protein
MATEARPRAVLGVKKANVIGVLARAHAIYAAIVAAAAMFPSPTVSMAALLVLIQATEAAQRTATSTRAKGTASARNLARNELWTAMESLRAFVQSLADTMAADGAIALIDGAGMLVAKSTAHGKALLAATLTTTPGTVHLAANATLLAGRGNRKKVNFHWSWSADGGRSWTEVHSTPYAETDIPGLALMVEHQFRVSVTVGKARGDWSQAVGTLVY